MLLYFVDILSVMSMYMLFQAEAIRRILGQDSNRKKREERKKKRVEELAQVLDTKCTVIIILVYSAHRKL